MFFKNLFQMLTIWVDMPLVHQLVTRCHGWQFNTVLQKPVASVFQVIILTHVPSWQKTESRRHRRTSWSRRVCSSFQRINNWTFYIYAKVKDSEAWWINLLKIRDDRRPAGSPHRMDLICDRTQRVFLHFVVTIVTVTSVLLIISLAWFLKGLH